MYVPYLCVYVKHTPNASRYLKSSDLQFLVFKHYKQLVVLPLASRGLNLECHFLGNVHKSDKNSLKADQRFINYLVLYVKHNS